MKKLLIGALLLANVGVANAASDSDNRYCVDGTCVTYNGKRYCTPRICVSRADAERCADKANRSPGDGKRTFDLCLAEQTMYDQQAARDRQFDEQMMQEKQRMCAAGHKEFCPVTLDH